MLNYVTRVLVGKASGAANTGTTVATLAAGDLLLVNALTGAVITTAADAAAATEVFVAQGTEVVGYPVTSSKIVKSSISHFTEQTYAPKQEQVDTLDFSSLTAGKSVRVTVVFKDKLRLIANRQTLRRIDHRTPATGFVLATELAKIVAKINKDVILSTFITAAVSGTNITLTGKPIFSNSVLDKYTFTEFQSFPVEVDPTGSFGQGIAYPVTETTKAYGGQGLGVQIQEQEHAAQGKLGVTDYRNFDRTPVAKFASASINYDQVHITHALTSQGDMQDLTEHPLQTTIAVATGTSQSTGFRGLLEAFVSGVAVTPPAGE